MQVGVDIDSDSSEGTSRPTCLGEEKEPGKPLDCPAQDDQAIQIDQGVPQDASDMTEGQGAVRIRDRMEIVGNQSGINCNDLKSVMDKKSKEPTTKEGHSTREARGHFAIETLPAMKMEAHVVDQHVESSRNAENSMKQFEKAHRHSKGGECRGRGDVGLQTEAVLGSSSSSVGPIEVWAPRIPNKTVQGVSNRRDKREDERGGTMRRREGGHRRRDEDSEEEALMRREEKERLREEWGGTIRRRESGKRRGGDEESALGRRREEDSTTLHRRREERRREEEVGTIRKREEGGSHRREKRREEENGTIRKREDNSGTLRRWEEEEKLRRRDEEGTMRRRGDEEGGGRRRDDEGTLRRHGEGENTLRRREDEGTLRRREEEGCVRRRRSSVKDMQRHEEDRHQVNKKTPSTFSTPRLSSIPGGDEKEEHLSGEKRRKKIQPHRPLMRCW